MTPVAAQGTRWVLTPDGGISWTVGGKNTHMGHILHMDGIAHTDHIEMAGKGMAAIVTYGVDGTGELVLKQRLIFPGLRMQPNDTRGSFAVGLQDKVTDSLLVDGRPVVEHPESFYIRGILRVTSETGTPLSLERTIFPSVDKRAYIELYTLRNTGHTPLRVHIPLVDADSVTAADKEVNGPYVLRRRTYNGGDVRLNAGEQANFSYVISAAAPGYFSAPYELTRRRSMVDRLFGSLVLKTPNDTINRMFAFAKLRAAESIYDTKAGLMHGPGGGDYYAAIWANDQAEYVDPFFPFLGNAEGNESARNSFRLFASYMNTGYKPIPSSIVAEGDSIWNGAGDRGDQAMIAYGASRFALASGDSVEARRLWPLITWCLEYLRRKETPEGVIVSQSDELEGRFPSGKINLSTNALAYGGFLYASRLAASLGDAVTASHLEAEATTLRGHIETYFGARVQGFDTYRYYEGNTVLRSWICLPLVMGIFDRAPQTIKALFSPYLWSPNGILTASGDQTFWDRATLYAFRGLFYAGATDTSYRYFAYYSRTRLLGEHVPYAVEAWPEGDQRQLSAESGLYCRAVTEGLFGIDALGLGSFAFSPRLPNEWKEMSLEHIRAFGGDIDIRVQGRHVVVTNAGRVVRDLYWDGLKPIVVHL